MNMTMNITLKCTWTQADTIVKSMSMSTSMFDPICVNVHM
jgi:hypothetical protein